MKIKLFTIIFLIACFMLTGCLPNEQPENISPTQQQFNSLVYDIKNLENISKNYNNNDYIKRTLIYIREGRYNSSEWQTIGGTNEQDFANYVAQNYENAVLLQTLANFTIPSTEEKVDFVHMVATINVVFLKSGNNQSDLAGWGGDLMQLVKEIKDLGCTSDQLPLVAKQKFNAQDSTFGKEDVCADLDAVNIASLMIANNSSLSTEMKNYYNNLSSTSRKNTFVSNVFGKTFNSTNELTETIVTRITSNFMLYYWGYKNGVSFQDDLPIINACTSALSQFLLS